MLKFNVVSLELNLFSPCDVIKYCTYLISSTGESEVEREIFQRFNATKETQLMTYFIKQWLKIIVKSLKSHAV